MMASEPWDVHVHRTTEQLAKTTDATKRAYIYLRRAHLYAQASDMKQSLADLRRCLRLAPSQTEILMQSAQVFEKLGYHDKGERLRVMARAREVAEPVSTVMSRIPMELLIRVLRLLPFVSLVQCRGVCQRWNESIIKHSVFWQAVYIRAPPPQMAAETAAHYQKKAFLTFLRRGGSSVRSVSIKRPLSHLKNLPDTLARLPLTSFAVESQYAPRWFVWALQQTHLRTLCLRSSVPDLLPAPGSSACQLQSLTLERVTMSVADTPLLRACDALAHFVYDMGDALHATEHMRTKYGTPPSLLVQHAHATLEHIELRGKAAWHIQCPPPHTTQEPVSYPHLRHFHAPLALLGRVALWPALDSFEVSIPDAAALREQADLLALTQAMCASLEVLRLRIGTNSDTRLACTILESCSRIHTLHVVLDAYGPTPPDLLWPTWDAALAQPLTPSLLLQMLTPGALANSASHVRVCCPRLRRLDVQDANTIRGRELLHLVHVRAGLAQQQTLADAWRAVSREARPDTLVACEALEYLDIDLCAHVPESVVDFVRQRVPHTVWHGYSRHRLDFFGTRERTFRARFT